jgi:hypothetical protein
MPNGLRGPSIPSAPAVDFGACILAVNARYLEWNSKLHRDDVQQASSDVQADKGKSVHKG